MNETVKSFDQLYEELLQANRVFEFWSVENTGWSGGNSWFKIGGTNTNPLRFKDECTASLYAKMRKHESNDPNMLWRVVHTTIEHFDNKDITTRVWNQV